MPVHIIRSALRLSSLCLVCTALALPASAQKPKTGGDAAKGKEVFEQCTMCHATDTDEKRQGPSLKGLYKRPKLTNGKPVNDTNVLEWINSGGNGMPGFGDMLSLEEKANLLAYLRTL